MDVADGPHIGVHGCPLDKAAVLSLLQQVLASTVVGELVEDPGTVLHMGRVDLLELPLVEQVAHIFTELHHLTAEVKTLVDANPEHTRGLQNKEHELSLSLCQG